MSRTILPPWSEFRKSLGVEQAEPIETFNWILDSSFKNDLQLAKNGMDTIEGSREFLKGYRRPLEWCEMDPMLYSIGCVMGDHHSGASASMLINCYTHLLNNWHEFVLKTKDSEHRKSYDNRQIHYSDQDDFLVALKKFKDPEDMEKAKFAELCSNFREKFAVTYDDDTLAQMIPLIKKEEDAEGLRKMAELEEQQVEDDVSLLTFLYKSPIRWFSYKGGIRPFNVNVTPEHIIRMRKLYPDYADHYNAVKKAMGDWEQMRHAPKPTAAFFEVFMTPWLVATEMCKMRLIYSDYDEHIKAIGKARETQLEREVLGKMFTGLESDE